MYFYEELSRGAVPATDQRAVPDVLVEIRNARSSGATARGQRRFDCHASYIRYEVSKASARLPEGSPRLRGAVRTSVVRQPGRPRPVT
jgi:hypothetical protein